MKGEHRTPEFLEINPLHTLPVLDDDGFRLNESRAIMQYLVDVKSDREELYPKDPQIRAKINNFLFFDATVLVPRILAICAPIIFEGETTVPADKKQKMYDAFEYLNSELMDKNWMVEGESFTIADISMSSIIASAIEAGADISHLGNLAGWYERCGLEIPFWDENISGAKIFASLVLKNIDEIESLKPE